MIVEMKDFAVIGVEESWNTDSIFVDTFSPLADKDLASVKIELRSADFSKYLELVIKPYKRSAWISYPDDGKGISTEVLISIIQTLTDGDASNITMEDFIQRYINRYADRYSVTVEKMGEVITEYNPAKREDLTDWKNLI